MKKHLRPGIPGLILTAGKLQQIKEGIKSDRQMNDYYQYLYQNAVSLLPVAPLTR